GRMQEEFKRFDSPGMRACRARLARALLASRRDFTKIEEDGVEVFDYFEDIGLLLRRRVVPAEFVWSMLGDYVLMYWQVLRDYVTWVRRSTDNPTYYEDFEFLNKRIAALEKKRRRVEPVNSEDELREFLEEEVEAEAGPPTGLRRRKVHYQVRCPH